MRTEYHSGENYMSCLLRERQKSCRDRGDGGDILYRATVIPSRTTYSAQSLHSPHTNSLLPILPQDKKTRNPKTDRDIHTPDYFTHQDAKC